jgi:tetratricopeptide (TPR) repeat protein
LAKKTRPSSAAPPWPVIKGRAEKAIREGRFQQALDLTKRIHEAEPTPTHLELLRKAYLGRAKQLRTQGQTPDALTVLHAALAVNQTTPVWLQQIAEELARCGEVKQALELLNQAPDAHALGRAMAGAADAALQQEAAGRALLPESLRADFDRILLAVREVEAGKDDDARATLQGIGLRSPFLEWKLLLRGLQAYYANDDARALENWQRLAPDRLPIRLAAPFRFHIDAEFRAAQSPEAHTALQQQLDRMDGRESLLPKLRKLRGLLTHQESLAAAFRQAETLLPALRRDAPQLEARLASCFYWAALETGPADLPRYMRVFGPPAHDPNFYRLEALANERVDNPEDAHRNWQKVEKEIAEDPKRWPSGQAERVRALIWLRMGRNAAGVPDGKKVADVSAFLRDLSARLPPLNPSADQCFRRALELAPDMLDAHEELIQLHRRAGRNAKAEKAARRLLEQTPDHAPTLEVLSDILLQKEEYIEALQLLQRAGKANSLNRDIRTKVVTAHLLAARSYSLADRFDEARREYETALNLESLTDAYTILGRWAASEYRAGLTERAEELVAQAAEKAPSALAVAYLMLGESVRLKLDRSVKGRFDKEFKAGLEKQPTAASAAALVGWTRALQASGAVYHGQKTHAKKVTAYVEQAAATDFTETQMEQVCAALVDLKSVRAARRFLDAAVDKFPANPYFLYWLAEISMIRGSAYATPPEARSMLDDARRLAEALPPGARRDNLLQDIQERLSALAAANPFAMGFMPDFFERMFGGRGGEDDDCDD